MKFMKYFIDIAILQSFVQDLLSKSVLLSSFYKCRDSGEAISINRLQNRVQYLLKVMHAMVKQHRTGNQIYLESKLCSCLPI